MSIKSGSFKANELKLIAKAPPPDFPPLGIGDICYLNSGSPPLTVVDVDENQVTISWRNIDDTVEEFVTHRECVRRNKSKYNES